MVHVFLRFYIARTQEQGFLWTFLVATQQLCDLITVRTEENDTQERDERIRKCISYLTEEFFRDFYLTMRRHRVTASNVKELFYMCCIHFLKDTIYICV